MNKKIYAVDLVLIVGSLIGLILLGSYARPLVIAPINDYETSKPILFSIEKADRIIIDDNLEFSSPDEFNAEEGLTINLKPGVYFWKAVSNVGLKSDVRKLTINSEIDLRLRKADKGYDIINAGNVNLNVDIYNGTRLIDSISVLSGGEENAEGNKFVGVENE